MVQTKEELHCSFCDPELPNGNIPGCTRPPTKKIRAVMFGEPTILDVCDHHYERMPVDSRPITPTPLNGNEAEYLSVRELVQIFCKGCGAVLVTMRKGDELHTALASVGLDAMVVNDHLNQCEWRRKTP